jgi:uncharacterized integral membrane protein
MRLLFIVMSLLLIVGFLGFVVTNLDARVGVTVWETLYPDVSLSLIVLLSILAGMLYVGVLGIAQGLKFRLDNRRLSREIQRLETELNYLRTQPARPFPDDEFRAGVPEPPASDAEEDAEPPSAPVYGGNDEDDEPDDDIYSGGRAV